MSDLPTTALAMAAAGKGDAVVVCQRLMMRVDVFEEALVLTRFDTDGRPYSTFEVSPVDVAAALSGIGVTTGLLPRECLFMAHVGGGERIGIYVPPGRRSLLAFPDEPALDVPLPGLVFCGEGVSYRVFAVKQRPGAVGERLFVAPMPNVGAGGLICAGTVRFPVASTATIYQALDLFLKSEFNADLANSKVHSERGDVRELWRKLAGKTRFPVNELVRSDWDLGELINGEVD